MKLILAVIFLSAISGSTFAARIVGGDDALAQDRPYQARIKVNGSPIRICSGSLISASYVLSAASCFDSANGHAEAKNLVVYLGLENTEDLSAEGVTISTVRNLAIHPGYKYAVQYYKNDIALLELKKPVLLNKKVQLVALPKIADKFTSFARSSAMILGWGETGSGAPTTTLQQAKVLVLTNDYCRKYYGTRIASTNICTEGKGSDRSLPVQPIEFDIRAPVGTCPGDSGAPLVINRKQIGISSYQHTACDKEFPSVFTRISPYLDWIEANSDAKIVV